MSEEINNENNEPKKKQKAGLNAVRPSDDVENMFKSLATEKNKSQTEFFYEIFYNYIRTEEKQEKDKALNFNAEINLISYSLNTILEHFKSIVDKSQNSMIALKSNAEQNETNLNLEIDTLKNRIIELETRNNELEQTNKGFSDIKSILELKIEELSKSLLDRESDKNSLNDKLHEKETQLKNMDANNQNLEKEVTLLKKEIEGFTEDINSKNRSLKDKDRTIEDLESSKRSLENSIKNIEEMKSIEVRTIEGKLNVRIAELESQLNEFEERKKTELDALEHKLEVTFEADKKLAIADMKLELAEMKSRYAEVIGERNKQQR